MSRKKLMAIYFVVTTVLLTWTFYQYRRSQPPDEAKIARCNELADKMPESTEEEINKNINTFLECLGK